MGEKTFSVVLWEFFNLLSFVYDKICMQSVDKVRGNTKNHSNTLIFIKYNFLKVLFTFPTYTT